MLNTEHRRVRGPWQMGRMDLGPDMDPGLETGKRGWWRKGTPHWQDPSLAQEGQFLIFVELSDGKCRYRYSCNAWEMLQNREEINTFEASLLDSGILFSKMSCPTALSLLWTFMKLLMCTCKQLCMQIYALNDLSYLLLRELSDLVLTPSSFTRVRDIPILNAVGCIRPSLHCLHGGFPVELEGQMSAFNHCLHEVVGHDSSQFLGGVGWAWWYFGGSALWLKCSATPHISSSFLSRVHSQLAPSCLPKKCQLQNKGMITGVFWLESCRAQQLPLLWPGCALCHVPSHICIALCVCSFIVAIHWL